ncbi:MAG: metal ABC transporter ATP-binding protein [Sedimentisphaerales bacterium]|nr:metal ABC transporter ATP-binding protein [Sedimentisphaerales bacterium]
MESLFTLTDVTVHRRGKCILSVERLAIGRGEFIGVIGPNGAGKTTLMLTCCGLIHPDSGKIYFNKQDITRLGTLNSSRIRRQFGYVPQSAHYHSELPFSLREVIEMGLAGVKAPWRRLSRDDRQHIDFWIERMGLHERCNHTFRSLSGGERQKCLIARALVRRPNVLMLDEPCANLDFYWKENIYALLDELHRELSLTIMLISHDDGLLPNRERRLLLLHQGRIEADGPAAEVLRTERLQKAYGINPL